ncbi:hypothetical protein [Nitriliruptor alkaliphilus]|uniref:hypothetical protein n=1 Tax=Nitriliruptor alkaliphilus TaxID=427918 RepID=UPI0012EE4905|nr:hypothetical protein [Nitriliruptor alkaliphilus]
MPRQPRGAAGVVIVASATVVVSASVIAAGIGSGSLWVFELLAATGLLVGLGAAFGAFDRGPLRNARRLRSARGELQVDAGLSASVEAQLRSLDAVEHRRLDLGAPWPTVVVGPTGVTVVDVAGRVSGDTVARSREVLGEVRRLTRAHAAGGRPIAVRALLVVPDHEVAPTVAQDVTAVAVADLAGAVARGPIVPMATVTALFAQLSGQLAPDLRSHAV